jgi:hypothetical protein
MWRPGCHVEDNGSAKPYQFLHWYNRAAEDEEYAQRMHQHALGEKTSSTIEHAFRAMEIIVIHAQSLERWEASEWRKND